MKPPVIRAIQVLTYVPGVIWLIVATPILYTQWSWIGVLAGYLFWPATLLALPWYAAFTLDDWRLVWMYLPGAAILLIRVILNARGWTD
jgi:hypothetical protein